MGSRNALSSTGNHRNLAHAPRPVSTPPLPGCSPGFPPASSSVLPALHNAPTPSPPVSNRLEMSSRGPSCCRGAGSSLTTRLGGAPRSRPRVGQREGPWFGVRGTMLSSQGWGPPALPAEASPVCALNPRACGCQVRRLPGPQPRVKGHLTPTRDQAPPHPTGAGQASRQSPIRGPGDGHS